MVRVGSLVRQFHFVLGEAVLAAAFCLSPALLPCRWSLQKGFVPLPKSNHAERQRANLDVFRWGRWWQRSKKQLLVGA